MAPTIAAPLIDAHTHLQDARCMGDLTGILDRARRAGVGQAVVCGTHPGDWPEVLRLCRDHAGLHPMLGLHPWWVPEAPPDWVDTLESLLAGGSAGIGECGLDHARASTDEDRARQAWALRMQVRMARRLDRPVALHCVRAAHPLASLLGEEGLPPAGGLIHAYAGGPEEARRFLDLGLHLSFGSRLLHPFGDKTRRALKTVPLDRLLLETDSPDQAPRDHPAWPFPHHEPAALPLVLEAAASLLGLPASQLAEQTTLNAMKLLRLRPMGGS